MHWWLWAVKDWKWWNSQNPLYQHVEIPLQSQINFEIFSNCYVTVVMSCESLKMVKFPKLSQQATSNYILGHIWTFVDIFGHFGTYMDILGHIRTYRVIFGHFGTYLDILGHIWTFWDIFGHIGTYSDILGHIWTFWDIFGHIGTYQLHFFTLSPSNSNQRREVFQLLLIDCDDL